MSMRSRIFLTVVLASLFVILPSCGTPANCPVCGTTKNGAYAVLDVIAVPEHNPTGEPGGPFNSFDISTIAPNPAVPGKFLDYISDRIGLDMVVIDTSQNIAVDALQGQNAVADGGNGASPCDPSIPPLISVFGNFTRFGCRNAPFHLDTGFGPSGNFGGFPGAQCCAARANGVNPMSGPDGNTTTPDGKFLFVGNGSSSVVVFDLTGMDLTTNPPTQPEVIADFPTGVSADYDGPLGIAPCVASWNGEAGSSADCGDDRGDEQALGTVNDVNGVAHQILAVIDGDPGLPFITFFDVTNVIGKTGTTQQQHCLPIDQGFAYGPYPAGFDPATYGQGGPYPFQATSQTVVTPQAGASFNPPSCVIGQIYYDGAGGLASPGVGVTGTVPVDNVGGNFPCPDPSNPQTFGGVSGSAAASLVPGIGVTPATGTLYTIPCHHGPIVSYNTGQYCVSTSGTTAPPGTQTPPFTDSTCSGAISPAGLGAMAFNPTTGHVLLTNANSIATTNIGSVDDIDLQLGTGNGPVVVNTFVTPNCMPTSIVQGPGNNFLVGCADHDGTAFPPNEYVIDGTAGTILATITNVGGVDEIWYNPTDNKYYLAARDMPTGAVMGVIDAGTNQWLTNFPTGSNAHSISVDPSTNHAFVPLQAGTICTTQSANGCVGVVGEQ
jgi:hypothetical protein